MDFASARNSWVLYLLRLLERFRLLGFLGFAIVILQCGFAVVVFAIVVLQLWVCNCGFAKARAAPILFLKTSCGTGPLESFLVRSKKH